MKYKVGDYVKLKDLWQDYDIAKIMELNTDGYYKLELICTELVSHSNKKKYIKPYTPYIWSSGIFMGGTIELSMNQIFDIKKQLGN